MRAERLVCADAVEIEKSDRRRRLRQTAKTFEMIGNFRLQLYAKCKRRFLFFFGSSS